MASMKADHKPVGTQLFGHVKKETTAKLNDSTSKTTTASKPAASKKAAQKPQEPKKKGKGGKSTKH